MNGMSAVSLPQVYRSYSKNFAFSVGLIPWTNLQLSIEDFRAATGGNLTEDSVQYLQNATLVFQDGSTESLADRKFKRAMDIVARLAAREINTSVNETDTGSDDESGVETQVRVAVSGIKAYVEELSIPSSSTFMTVLLVVAIVIASIAVIILLVKVILETWALFGSFPKGLTGFRKHYWLTMGRTITQLILLLYGTWVLYCIFQFTTGDSWAATALAAVTLALFTGILAFFAYKIFTTAKKLKETDGDASQLYENKNIWIKYSLFYENYKKDYWWIFVPTILYMLAKGIILAAGDNHGMAQSIAQLIVEALMLCVLLWNRPYERKSGNVINITIAVVRVLSVACILIFVDEFAVSETTSTVTGVVLIAIQAALTGVLALLIAWNAIIAICKENPHRKRRKEMGKSYKMDLIEQTLTLPRRENARPRQPHSSRRPQLPVAGPQGVSPRLRQLFRGQDKVRRQGELQAIEPVGRRPEPRQLGLACRTTRWLRRPLHSSSTVCRQLVRPWYLRPTSWL